MITMMVVVKVRPEKLKEFLQAMGSIQNHKNEEKGIRGSKLYQDVNDGPVSAWSMSGKQMKIWGTISAERPSRF